jgi:hypothetical protein
VAEGPIRRAPGACVHLDDLAPRDRPQQVDVVDGHVQEVGMRHPAAPVARRDPGRAQVAPARNPDPEQPAEGPVPDEPLEPSRLAPEPVVLGDHHVTRGALCRRGDRRRIREGQGEGLLDEDVAPLGQARLDE